MPKTSRRAFIASSAAFAAASLPGLAETSDDVRLVDFHAHCTEFPSCALRRGGPRPLCTPDDLLRLYDALGVEKGCVHPVTGCETVVGAQSVEEVLRICRAHPDRLVPFMGFDPRGGCNTPHADFLPLLESYRERGCRGLGEIVANLDILDGRVQNLFEQAERAGLPVSFSLSPNEGWGAGLVDRPGLPGLGRTLRRFPKLRLVGSGAVFWSEIGGDAGDFDRRVGCPQGPVLDGALPRLMRAYPNLWADLSGPSGCNALARDRTHAAKFLTEFQDRILFGLDVRAPSEGASGLGGFLRELRSAGEISSVVFGKVGRENALRMLAFA